MGSTLSERHAEAATALPATRHIIGGSGLDSAPCGHREQVDPSTGGVQGAVPLAGAAEVDAAVEAAREAFPRWRDMAPGSRQGILYRFADLLEQHQDELATLSVLENGAARMTAGFMVGTAADWTRYYAGWVDKLVGEVSSHRSDPTFAYTIFEPLGVIGAIITWNGPMMQMGMKVAPALAAGNTVVCKPAEQTPFTTQRFVELAAEAGLPPGVLNLVHGGVEAGTALSGHPGVDKITFTGGPATGRRILAASAELLRPAVMELGGKSANLVFADADLDQAVPTAVTSCMINAGQGCSLPTRLLVEADVYDTVLERAAACAEGMSVGDPLLADTLVGPVISGAARRRILGMVERARSSGAGRVVAGGRAPASGGEYDDGYFIEPTVLGDVDPASEIARNEVFGPVLTVTPFSSEEEAVALANGTEYGLAAYIQCRDQGRVTRLTYQLHAGTVFVNGAYSPLHHAPFGGVGISGFGREGGRAGIEEFLYRKSVLVGS